MYERHVTQEDLDFFVNKKKLLEECGVSRFKDWLMQSVKLVEEQFKISEETYQDMKEESMDDDTKLRLAVEVATMQTFNLVLNVFCEMTE